MPKLKLPDIEKVVAIDIHTHAEEPCGLHGDDGYDDFQERMAEYFKSPHKHPPTVPETAAYYRSKNIAAVIFPVDAERETGFRRYNNYEMLEVASDNLDVLIPFVSIDPHKGKLGVREAKKLMEEYGVRGFKFHPTMQGFYANDRMAYPLYEAINDGGAIALFHTGQTGVGSGMPGGMGMRLKYSNPMYMDDVAADFPDLKIILAHPSFPWQEEALSVATHKPNVYIDLSGWSPKYFPPILVRYVNSILQDKMLFGSDWPVITPNRTGASAAVVLLHSCNANWRRLDERWGRVIASWGYVTLTVDSRLNSNCRNAALELAQDAYRALNFLVRHPAVDPARVAALGFSQGGWLAMSSVERGALEQTATNKFRAAIAFYPPCRQFKDNMTVPTLILVGELDDWST